jgi:two-component system sensor histidine kinase PilS (NtrC family)
MPRNLALSSLRAGRDGIDVPIIAPEDLLRRRITTYIFLKIVLSTVLFGIASFLVLREPDTLISRSGLFVLAAITYVILGVSAGLVSRVRNLFVFTALQLLFDVSLITALVLATGGIGSLFFVLYFMNIVAGAYLGYGRTAMATAAVDALAFVSTTALTVAGIIPGEDMSTGVSFFADASLRVAGFLLVGVLTGRLAENVRLADHALIVQRERARALEDEFGLIIQSVPSGILIVDPGGIVKGANPAALNRVGLCEGWAISRVLPGFMLDDGSQELKVDGPGGARVLLCQASPLGDEGGRVIVFEDVTRLREMEEEIEREERLVGVGKIAAAIAHEIRNPLASLSGSIQLLREEAPGPLVDIALREISRLNDLVGDFLSTAGTPTLKKTRAMIGDIARDVATVLQQDPRYKGLIRVEVLAESEPLVLLDVNRFRQILWNLVLNGAQSMPDGGVVSIRFVEEEAAVIVEVSDRGMGIDASDLPKLFHPFYTTRQGGTGLGLATVHRLVRAHEGSIEARSTPGQGTTMRICFPRGLPSADEPNLQPSVPSEFAISAEVHAPSRS